MPAWALTATRTYRDAWTPAQALTALDTDAGSKLDARCVAALHRALVHLGVPLGELQPHRGAGGVALPRAGLHSIQVDDALLPGAYEAVAD